MNPLPPLPPPGPVAVRAVEDAVANVGVTEDRVNGVWTNWGRYIRVYLAAVGILQPAPWCLAFAEYRWAAAAKAIGRSWPPVASIGDPIPITGYCPTLGNWAVKSGRVVPWSQVQKGDLLLLWFPSLGGWHHAAMIRYAPNGMQDTFYTVEGNSNDVGSRDGYEVCLRKRYFTETHPKSIVVRLPF